MVLGSADALQESGDASGRAQLANKLHGTDVDPELERSGGDHRPQLTRAKTRLDPEPAVHGKAPVVSLHTVLPEPLGQLVGDALGHPPGVDEHKRRAALGDVAGDAF